MTNSNRLKRSRTPEELGVSSAAIISFLDELRRQSIELHSFMLLCKGVVAAEAWWAPYGPQYPHMLFSLSKSFTSTAVGMAEAEGYFSIEDPVLSFFPELAPEKPSDHIIDLKIRHLLTMSSGHVKDAMEWIRAYNPDNWVKGFLHSPIERRPGTHFLYNNGASYMLSAIVQKTTGMTLLEYLQPRLLTPLGIENATWGTCPRGINLGGWGLSLTTEDIAKFGQLYLQKGQWDGKPLLPETWVEKATSAQMSNGTDPNNDWNQGYGFQFWRCRHNVYRGDGMFSQFCIVLPERDAVLAITAASRQMQTVLNTVWDKLLPGLEAGDVPRSTEETGSLKNTLQSLALPLPRFMASSAREPEWSGKRYHFPKNDDRICSLTAELHDNEVVVTVGREDGESIIPCGREQWRFSQAAIITPNNQHLAAACTWRDDRTLVVTLCFVETPFIVTMELRFESDRLRLDVSQNVGRPQKATYTGSLQ